MNPRQIGPTDPASPANSAKEPDNDTVDTRLLAWQPARAELAWEKLGWVLGFEPARRMAERTGRPIFLLICPGGSATGPQGALSLRVRQFFQSQTSALEIVRDGWIVAIESGSDFAKHARVPDAAAAGARFAVDSKAVTQDRIELRDPLGRLLEVFMDAGWSSEGLTGAIRRHASRRRSASGLSERPPWRMPDPPDGGMRLGVVSRFFQGGGETWKALDVPDDFRSTVVSRRWVLLDARETLSTGPRDGHAFPGETWTLERGIAERIARALAPCAFTTAGGQDRIVSCRLDAAVTQIGRGCSARLSGHFDLELRSPGATPPVRCTGRWSGYAVFGADRLPRKFRLCTHEAMLAGFRFGAVVGDS